MWGPMTRANLFVRFIFRSTLWMNQEYGPVSCARIAIFLATPLQQSLAESGPDSARRTLHGARPVRAYCPAAARFPIRLRCLTRFLQRDYNFLPILVSDGYFDGCESG
jgi:hypothetical protein